MSQSGQLFLKIVGILFNPNSDERTLLFRAIMLLGWVIMLVLVINAIFIGLVGAYTDITLYLDGVTDIERAFRAGYLARVRFFREYEIFIVCIQVLIIAPLVFFGKLPLITKSD